MNEPRTLTEAIGRLQTRLMALPWTDQVLGRASLQADQHAGQDKPQARPMVFDPSTGDYIDARPDDDRKSVIFFAASQVEKNDFSQEKGFGFAPGHIGRPRRPVVLYGWVNLAELPDYDDGSGFPELIKVSLKRTLKEVTSCVASIGDYQDGPMNEVFKPFLVSDLNRKYDRWPYACFRVELILYTIEKH